MEIKKKWKIPEYIYVSPDLIAAAGDPVVAEILYRRGYTTTGQINEFLQIAYKPYDFEGHPMLVPLIERIEHALTHKEKITVYGDYDVDGITSTAVWMETLRYLEAEVAYHVPDRFEEGYGMNTNVLRDLADTGTKLVITCDCGISNYQEIEDAKAWGIDVLITDHHELPERLPAAPAFNPKMLGPEHPAYMMPGVGVSFIVARELLRRAGKETHADTLLEMLALGIIADVVPLIKDNRWYLKQGLPRLFKSERPGIKALLAVARINPACSTEEDIAFQIIPRLNAAGRLDSARLAVDLLLAADLPTAQKRAAELNRLNEVRKVLCERMMQEALGQIGDHIDKLSAVALYQENWPEGVIGIVAGRLAEQYQKPALLMTRKENGLITGSARAGGNINIFQALSACKDLLVKFGGHECAAGFSLYAQNIEEFIEKINEVVGAMPLASINDKTLLVDAVLSPEQVNMDLYTRIRESLGPFGQDNPPPVFLINGQLVGNQLMKTGSAHRRLRFAKHGQTADAVWWNSAQAAVTNQEQFLARLRLNLFRDNINVQMDIQDVLSFENAGPQPRVKGQLIDMRGIAREEIEASYPQALFFGEGLDYSFAASRLELAESDTLVLLTIPSQVTIWAEILEKVVPQRVIVAWERQTKARTQMVDDAWRQLMGMIKFSLRVYDGIMTPRRVAAHLGWTRAIVESGLMALAEIGLIDLTVLDAERISVSIRQDALPNFRNLQGYRCFAKMLAEVEGYRNYIRNASVEKISELLQAGGGTASCTTSSNVVRDGVRYVLQ